MPTLVTAMANATTPGAAARPTELSPTSGPCAGQLVGQLTRGFHIAKTPAGLCFQIHAWSE